MHRIAVTFLTLALMAPVPASAQHRTYSGRSVVMSPSPGARPAYVGGWGYNQFTYGASCVHYGYPPNCAYWELPDWNGGMEIRNPGGG
jgi:hypothetical protein